MPHDMLNYTRCAVVVHGKSELVLVKYIYTNLHLPVKIIAKDKGRGSIQINGLMDFLNKKQFRTIKEFANEYSVEYDKKTKRLKNFKLFTIMDTDDCDEATKEKYISGKLFDGHPLKEYIVPVYNITNLEDVMLKAGIMVKRIPASQPSLSAPVPSRSVQTAKQLWHRFPHRASVPFYFPVPESGGLQVK